LDLGFDKAKFLPLDQAQLIIGLEIDPELRRGSEIPAEPKRVFGGDRAPALNDLSDEFKVPKRAPQRMATAAIMQS
jgi:hypothetical protein